MIAALWNPKTAFVPHGGAQSTLPYTSLEDFTIVDWARRSPGLRARLDATPTLEERRAAVLSGADRRASTRAKWAARQASKAVRP